MVKDLLEIGKGLLKMVKIHPPLEALFYTIKRGRFAEVVSLLSSTSRSKRTDLG